jgi:hypothetical protein
MQYHAFNVSPTKGRMNSPPPTPRENTGRTAASAGEAGPGMRKRTYPQISQIDADGENQEEDARVGAAAGARLFNLRESAKSADESSLRPLTVDSADSIALHLCESVN